MLFKVSHEMDYIAKYRLMFLSFMMFCYFAYRLVMSYREERILKKESRDLEEAAKLAALYLYMKDEKGIDMPHLMEKAEKLVGYRIKSNST